jgi:hypothetical protein
MGVRDMLFWSLLLLLVEDENELVEGDAGENWLTRDELGSEALGRNVERLGCLASQEEMTTPSGVVVEEEVSKELPIRWYRHVRTVRDAEGRRRDERSGVLVLTDDSPRSAEGEEADESWSWEGEEMYWWS